MYVCLSLFKRNYSEFVDDWAKIKHVPHPAFHLRSSKSPRYILVLGHVAVRQKLRKVRCALTMKQETKTNATSRHEDAVSNCSCRPDGVRR